MWHSILEWLQQPSPKPATKYVTSPLHQAATAVYLGRNRSDVGKSLKRPQFGGGANKRKAKSSKTSKKRQPPAPPRSKPQPNDDAMEDDVDIEYIQRQRFGDTDFIRVRWTTDSRADTWEPIDHMRIQLGDDDHQALLDQLKANPTTRREPLILIPGTRIGNDGSTIAIKSYKVVSLWDRYENGDVVIYRVHWYGYTHKVDTFETRKSLIGWMGEQHLLDLEQQRSETYTRTPNPTLPIPDHASNDGIIGDISMGYTEHRRFLLNKFATETFNLSEKLSLWSRRHTRHGNEWTTNRVEGIFRWIKWGGSTRNIKVVSKRTSTTTLIRILDQEHEYRKINQEDKASKAATKSRTDKSAQPHNANFSDGVTRFAYNLADRQWTQSYEYTCKRCVCDSTNDHMCGTDDESVEDTDAATHAQSLALWYVKRKHAVSTALPMASFWRTRRVSILKQGYGHVLVCTCTFWTTLGIPCRHVLCVYHNLSTDRRLALEDVDIRWWVEFYRALPNIIFSFLWGKDGIFSDGYVLPKGPSIDLRNIKLRETNVCNMECHAEQTLPDYLVEDPPQMTTHPSDGNHVDVRELIDRTAGKRTYVRPTQGAATSSKPNLYTPTSKLCDELLFMISTHPSVQEDAHDGVARLLEALRSTLPINELNRVSESSAHKGSEQIKRVVEPIRGPASSDDRHLGASDF
jgi:hypothetical protein